MNQPQIERMLEDLTSISTSLDLIAHALSNTSVPGSNGDDVTLVQAVGEVSMSLDGIRSAVSTEDESPPGRDGT